MITRAEALAIFGNAELVAQLGLPVNNNYWTIEDTGAQENYAWFYSTNNSVIDEESKSGTFYVLPIRKENFYGLPLIDSEFGGGLVFDVVAETRTVSIAAKWAEVTAVLGSSAQGDWGASMALFPVTLENIFTSMPTRAQALKIFGNSYLVTLLGLPVDDNDSYWTSEDVDADGAWFYYYALGILEVELKSSLYYALPVRSEVVPET